MEADEGGEPDGLPEHSGDGSQQHRAGLRSRRSCRQDGPQRGALPSAQFAEVAEIAELLLSELLTNAVQAARATVNDMPVNVRLSANRDRLLIEVWDSNVQPPIPRMLENDFPALHVEGGRGLFLVETLSQRWGWYPTRNPDGKVTWCEVGPE